MILNSVSRIAILMIVTLGLLLISISTVRAADALGETCSQGANKNSQLCKDYLATKGDKTGSPLLKLLKNITNIMSFVAGSLAVIFVMYGGFKYITSAGDASKAANGRQTLIYALVGLVVVIIARPLILFALGKLVN